MKASELRIGNHFMDRGGKVLRLDFWDSPGKLAMNNVVGGITFHPYTEEVGYASPIPLTEEWLLKFGFEDDEPHNKIALDEHGVMTLCFNQYSKMISLFSTGAHYYMPEIQYIHQIQNLYFALTGNDLEIKEGKDNVNDGQTGQMVEDRPGS